MNDLWTEPKALDGRLLRLEPVSLEHHQGLARNLLTPHAWHAAHWGTKTPEQVKESIVKATLAQKNQTGIGFAMVIKETKEAVGISHYMNLNRKNNYLEIGGTWVGEKWHKTFVNTEAKYLMLTRAFESIGCKRVEFRVNSLNMNSQRAVLRIGAKYEGELRQSMTFPDGRQCDYKVYSIIHTEWATLK